MQKLQKIKAQNLYAKNDFSPLKDLDAYGQIFLNAAFCHFLNAEDFRPITIDSHLADYIWIWYSKFIQISPYCDSDSECS